MNPAKHDTCSRLHVPSEACYLRFSDDKVARTEHIGTSTRNELVIMDYDAFGCIVGIELVGDGKPCQQR